MKTEWTLKRILLDVATLFLPELIKLLQKWIAKQNEKDKDIEG